MKAEQYKDFRTRLGNIKASQTSSRLSSLPAVINEATTRGAATVKERPTAVNPRPAIHDASEGMVELTPATRGFLEPPTTEFNTPFKAQSATLNPPALHPWQPTSQLRSPSTQLMAPPASTTPRLDPQERHMKEVLERLQAHAEQISRLSSDPEVALREFQKLARDLKGIGRDSGVFVEIDDFLDWSNLASQAVRVERSGADNFLITTKLIDIRRARHDAEHNAETLRRFQSQNSRVKGRSGESSELLQAASLLRWVWKSMVGLVEHRPVTRGRRVSSRAASQTAIEPTISIQSSLLWLGGAVIVRLGLDLMLATNPSLWFVAIAVIAAPAVIALFRVAREPQNGFVMGVNLFLIMIGLLVGGRF